VVVECDNWQGGERQGGRRGGGRERESKGRKVERLFCADQLANPCLSPVCQPIRSSCLSVCVLVYCLSICLSAYLLSVCRPVRFHSILFVLPVCLYTSEWHYIYIYIYIYVHVYIIYICIYIYIYVIYTCNIYMYKDI
jgi:hypothetical protein